MLIKGRTSAPFALDLGVSRNPEEIGSLEAALKHFLGVPLSNPKDPKQENLDCVVHRRRMGGG